jgi:hypothetical protein
VEATAEIAELQCKEAEAAATREALRQENQEAKHHPKEDKFLLSSIIKSAELINNSALFFYEQLVFSFFPDNLLSQFSYDYT